MKKLLYLPFLVLALSTSCKKEEKQTTIKTNYGNQFSFKCDGKFQVLNMSASLDASETMIVIDAETPSLNTGHYQLYFQTNILPGVYEYGASSQPVIAFNFYKNNKSYDAYDGTFHILSNDPVARRIEFKFQIKLYYVNSPSDNFEITEGYVVANY